MKEYDEEAIIEFFLSSIPREDLLRLLADLEHYSEIFHSVADAVDDIEDAQLLIEQRIALLRNDGSAPPTRDDFFDSLFALDPRTLDEGNQECGICGDKFGTADAEHAVRLPCGHVIGKDCVTHWLNEEWDAPSRHYIVVCYKESCPFCRRTLYQRTHVDAAPRNGRTLIEGEDFRPVTSLGPESESESESNSDSTFEPWSDSDSDSDYEPDPDPYSGFCSDFIHSEVHLRSLHERHRDNREDPGDSEYLPSESDDDMDD